MSLLQKLASPEHIVHMSLGDKLMGSFYVAVLGMLITFIALLVLWGLINCMTLFVNGKETNKPKPQVVKKDDDEELVAVITAAIMSMNGNRKIGIKDIVRIR